MPPKKHTHAPKPNRTKPNRSPAPEAAQGGSRSCDGWSTETRVILWWFGCGSRRAVRNVEGKTAFKKVVDDPSISWASHSAALVVCLLFGVTLLLLRWVTDHACLRPNGPAITPAIFVPSTIFFSLQKYTHGTAQRHAPTPTLTPFPIPTTDVT